MKTIIKLIALITAGHALYDLYPNFGLQSIRFIWSYILYGSDVASPILIYLGFLATLLPFLKLAVAYGLFFLRSWSLNIAIGTLGIDFLIRFIGAVNFVSQVMQYHNKPIPSIPKGAVVTSISMWPSYIIALICGVSIFILLQPSSKRILKPANELI